MKYYLIPIFCAGFIFIGWVCGPRDDDYPVAPVNTEVPLISSSFEANGKFTMDGWILTESSLSRLVDSCDDTPYSSSRSSLRLRRDTVTFDVPGVTKSVISVNADTSKRYTLSFFVKGKGTILVQQRTEDGPKGETYYVNSSIWNSVTFSLFKARAVKDTISIIFRPLNIDPIPYLILDDVRLIYWRKN